MLDKLMNLYNLRLKVGVKDMGQTPAIDSDYKYRSDEVIAQGCLTNSKSADCHVKPWYPTHITKGKGSYLFSKDRKFVDFICGLGTNLLGYANKEIIDVAYNEMCKGMSYSIPSRVEVEAAEMLRNAFSFQQWKFLKTGTEATMASLKIARTYTGRQYVLTHGYHGWSSEFVCKELTPPGYGVPPQSFIHKLESIDQINDQIAAVIIEPVITDHSIDRMRWLSLLKERCREKGTVLIYDEVITGCRFKKLSVSNFIGDPPDLIVLGKAMANGFPLAAVGGRKELMNTKDYFVSSTYAGENVSLKVCEKVIKLLLEKQDYNIDNLWSHGQDFIDAFNTLWPEKIFISGYPTRGIFCGDESFRHVFFQECVKAGILFGPTWFYNFPHTELSYGVLEHIRDIITRFKIEIPQLSGEKPCPPFALQSRKQ